MHRKAIVDIEIEVKVWKPSLGNLENMI
jgi:hypothetical protein